MNNVPLISVVINTYNGEKVITDTINSILKQTVQDFEIIIVDDCSTDETIKRVEEFEDSRIHIYINDENRGAYYGASRGIKLARGKYIARSDQDDISYPKRFERQLKYMEQHPEIFICGTLDENWYSREQREAIDRPAVFEPNELKYSLLFCYMVFSHSTFFFRRSEAVEKNIFYVKYKYSEDYQFMTTAALKSNIGLVREVLSGYRVHDGQVSKYCSFKQENKEIIKEYCKALGYNNHQYVILYKGHTGGLVSWKEFKYYTKMYYLHARMMGLNIKRKGSERTSAIYIYRINMRLQKQRNIIELLSYLTSGLCDWKFIFSKLGFKYIFHCLKNGFKKTSIEV